MLTKRHVPTILQNLNYEENLVKHYKKLEEIHKDERKKKNVDKDIVEKTKYVEGRDKTIKFHIHEKSQAIEKDNELLLGRLVEISRKKPGVLSQTKSENTLPRTLNGPSRRREKDRIAAENEAFARRLLSQQPSFNPKKLESDYEKHNQRVKSMAKITIFSPRKIRLPPIKYADDVNKKQEKNTKVEKGVEKKKNNEQSKEVKTEGDNPDVHEANIEANPDLADDNAEQEKELAAARLAKEVEEAKLKEITEKEQKEREAKEKEAAQKEVQENETKEVEVKEEEAANDVEEEKDITQKEPEQEATSAPVENNINTNEANNNQLATENKTVDIEGPQENAAENKEAEDIKPQENSSAPEPQTENQ